VGLRGGTVAKIACYGSALALTLVAGMCLIGLGL
jgi:hypothetical protein